MVKVTQGVQARFFLYDSLGRLLRVRQPEQVPNANLNASDAVTGNPEWTAGFSYDANGNLLTALDAKGVQIASTYDNLNRAVSRTYSDGTPTVSYSYDNPNIQFSKGKLTQVQNAVSTSQALAFDNLGRTLASRQITDGINYDSAYLYNLSGALVEETYPSGRKVKNTFEADGDLSKIETQRPNLGWEIRAQNLSYTSSGVLEKLQIGNGLWETAQLNSRLQVTQLGLGTSPTDASIWKLNYDFGNSSNNDGNIKSQTLTTPGGTFNQTFVYDSLDRLKQATETSAGNQTWVQNFSYDRYGNRVGFNQTINGQTTNGTPSVDVNTNRFNAGQGYVYDFAGNVVQDPQNRQFIFNGDNKQVQVKDANQNVIGTYFYDGDGKRIKKVSNSDTTTFVYSGGKLVAEYAVTTATPTNPTTNYLGTDMLESPRILTDQNAQVVSRRDFMPFGEDIPNFGARTQSNGYKPDNLRQKFTGYEKDNETGLDFAEARYYHSSVGRFTAVDPLLASGKSANPQTFNRYVYSLNSPIVLSDPSGLQVGGNNQRCPDPCPNRAGTISGSGSDTTLNFNRPIADVTITAELPPVEAAAINQLTREMQPTLDDAADGAKKAIPNFFINTWNFATNAAMNNGNYSGVSNPNPFYIDPYEYISQRAADYGSAGEFAVGAAPGVVAPVFAGSRAISVVPKGNELVGGSIRNVNPFGCRTNCANTAIATDATLAGRPASALRGGPTPISQLESVFGRKFVPMSQEEIGLRLAKTGDGSRGIIFGSRGSNRSGHFFNGVNQNGNIRFLDGQTGKPANWSGYQRFYFMRTTP
jgi:RHS repeat-associated protein